MSDSLYRKRPGAGHNRPVPGYTVAVLLALTCLTPVTAAAVEDLGAAPAFSLETTSGETVTLHEILKKGPVVLDFWATWCGPCRKALPRLQDLYEAHAEDGLTVIAVSTDEPRNRPKIDATVRSLGLTFPVLTDGDKEVARLYRVDSVPTTFLISQAGRVTAYHRGYREGDEKRLAAEIKELLAETRVSQ
jgi:cytochrome c biogenesis protein CcmG, thiol:disulfide interchange protein DsbE